MPDGNLAKGFIGAAKRLIPASAKRPTQASLRRAISTSYYAVFHALAKMAADSLVGVVKAKRSDKAWVEVYRGLTHGHCKTACEGAKNIRFPEELHDFSDAFMQLQEARHLVDYDPMIRVRKEDALFYISLAERSIQALKNTGMLDRRAFATWVLITSQGAKNARQRAKVSNSRVIPRQGA